MNDHQERPRIVSVSRDQKSLIDYGDQGAYVPYHRERSLEIYREAKNIFTDKEIVLLVLWAIISPLAALAYLLWSKYHHLRILAVVLLFISLVQFAVQWQGVYTFLHRFVTP